jgi:large subunit ribosomal protein L21
VTEGQTLDIEHLGTDEGATVELDRVLLVADGDKITVGNPVIDGAKVVAKTEGNVKGNKVIVFKYKPKVRYRRKNGHRQLYTRLSIENIMAPGMEQSKPAKRTRRKKKEVTEDGA